MKKFENSHVFSSGTYPDTVGVDETSPGAKDGSEYVKEGYGEWWGFFQALLFDVGITPSGSTELKGASDILDGIKKLIGGKKIEPITASVAANALTITLNPTFLDFRSTTLGSGAVNHRKVSSAISLVLSSGSTLGTVNTIQSRIAIIAIDNAGTVELAAVNLAGGNDLTETGLISTVAEGGAGAADSANVIYSATLRNNVAYKVVGFIESTQVTAGAWATAPSTIQGYGGQAFASMSSVGYGQTWQDVSGSRVVGTTYYNNTGKPIMIVPGLTSDAVSTLEITVDGVVITGNSVDAGRNASLSVVVPPGSAYSADMTLGVVTVNEWSELS